MERLSSNTSTGNRLRKTEPMANGEYDVDGRLNRLSTLSDQFTLSYLPGDSLELVTDSAGRQLTFSYVNGRLDSITAPDGSTWLYHYDTQGNLDVVTYPDQTPAETTDNPRRTYLYKDSRFPSHLTGIVDERGNRVAIWTYDDQGRAISSEHAGGTDRHTLVYHADGTTTVTDPQGCARTYAFSNQSGLIKVASVTGGDCAHCGDDAASYTYDANGFVASATDFNGNVTTYTRDARGRELSRTEAAGTGDARTVTTTWQTNFNQPLTVAEPGRLTTYTYDTDGRRPSSVIQSQP